MNLSENTIRCSLSAMYAIQEDIKRFFEKSPDNNDLINAIVTEQKNYLCDAIAEMEVYKNELYTH